MPHLRRDGDDPHATLSWLVTRQLGECLSDLRRARYVSTTSQYPHMAAGILAYHAGYALRPLASHHLVRLRVTVNGRRLRLTIRLNSSDLHVFREIFLHGALDDVVGDQLAEARTIVDLGSNIGLATAYLACWATRATFYCAEPAPENNVVARRTANDNSIDAVIESIAVLDYNGSVKFYPNQWWASSSTVMAVINARTTRAERFEHSLILPSKIVPTSTVTTFLQRHRLAHVDLMKIDVEGAELQIMQGDTDWLDAVDTVAIEIHRKYVNPVPVEAAFARHGMRRLPRSGPLDVFTRTARDTDG